VEIYYVGIIDILIQYQARKKIEGFFKSVAYAGEEVSVSQPGYYANRFYAFMKDIVGKPSTEAASESSSSIDETEILGDLPEPGTGEIIRPENSRSSAMSTTVVPVVPVVGQTTLREKRGTKQGGDNRQSKILDKASAGTQ